MSTVKLSKAPLYNCLSTTVKLSKLKLSTVKLSKLKMSTVKLSKYHCKIV